MKAEGRLLRYRVLIDAPLRIGADHGFRLLFGAKQRQQQDHNRQHPDQQPQLASAQQRLAAGFACHDASPGLSALALC
jgi:hypothetical protein